LPESFFRPRARLKEGRLLAGFASCCMDTSDGLIHTADTLMRLNRCRFAIRNDWEKILHPLALQVCRAGSIPPWLVLAAVHGEFELCFTVGPEKEKDFAAEAKRAGWSPIEIGEVVQGEGVSIGSGADLTPLDTARIRNIAQSAGSDPGAYMGKLFEIAREAGIP